jgi:hypothetical protein
MLLVVLYATFKFVFLNVLVTFLTSCPKYVNVVHLFFACVFSCSFGWLLFLWLSPFNLFYGTTELVLVLLECVFFCVLSAFL